MRQHWIHLVLLTGIVSAADGQERRPVPTPGPERSRERTLMVSPEIDRIYFFNINRGKMGITVSIRPEASDSIGALVDAVSPGSPAFKAGVQSGDIITRFNGRSVPTMAREGRKGSPGLALLEVALGLNVGDTARLEYRRGVNRRNVAIVLEPEYSSMTPIFRDRLPRGNEPVFTQEWHGEFVAPDMDMFGPHDEPGFLLPLKMMAELELAPMNPGLGQYFGVTVGVLVIRAPEGSTLNLRSGDVVTLVDGRRVSSPNQFFRVLRSYGPGEQFRFEIVRMKRKATVAARLPER